MLQFFSLISGGLDGVYYLAYSPYQQSFMFLIFFFFYFFSCVKSDDCQYNALGIRDDILPSLAEGSFCPAPDTNLDIDPRKGTGNDQIPDTGYRCCHKDDIKQQHFEIKSNPTPPPVNVNSENNLCVDHKDIGFRYVFINIESINLKRLKSPSVP